jgi:hypothetical protein
MQVYSAKACLSARPQAGFLQLEVQWERQGAERLGAWVWVLLWVCVCAYVCACVCVEVTAPGVLIHPHPGMAGPSPSSLS